MKRGDVVIIIYQDRAGQFSKRHIRIISANDKIIRAYCFERGQMRTFSVDRIFASQRVRSA